MTRFRLSGLVVAVIMLIATTGACSIIESPRERATRHAVEGVRRDVDWTKTTMKGLLRDNWEFGHLSAKETMETFRHSFGWRDGTLHSGAIFAMSSEPGGTVHADMVRQSGASAGGGLNYVGVLAVGCVRFSGKPQAEPVVTAVDITCPKDLTATTAIIVKVASST
jgi:hypothetical protein